MLLKATIVCTIFGSIKAGYLNNGGLGNGYGSHNGGVAVSTTSYTTQHAPSFNSYNHNFGSSQSYSNVYSPEQSHGASSYHSLHGSGAGYNFGGVGGYHSNDYDEGANYNVCGNK